MFFILPNRKMIAGFFIVLSCFGWAVCVTSFFYARRVINTYDKAQGHVISLEPSSVGNDETAYFATFSFVDAKGIEHTVRSHLGSSPAQQKVGDIIPVLYLPSQPERARIGTDDYVWGLTMGTGVPSAVFLPLGLLILFWPSLIKRFKKEPPVYTA